MKRQIKLKADLTLTIDGETRSYRADDFIEIDEQEGIRLIREGLALPGFQYSVGEMIEIENEPSAD
ncbi:MAG: hypothetical protein FJ110_04580 [Deltaproteobacteria bacterium]|nr:hypothetical protein [Deltaproteobacteria bacterium]